MTAAALADELQPVRLVEVSGRAPRLTEVAVLPDDLLRLRVDQHAISVTSTPPSVSGVSPFGESSDYGGSWEQFPADPIDLTTWPA